MPGRLTRRQSVAALSLAVVALLLITLDLGGSGLRGAHTGVRGAMGALYRGTDGILGPVRRFVEGVPSAGREQSTIQRLQHDNEQLRGQLAQLTQAQNRSRQLSALQAGADRSGLRIQPATVTALGPAVGFDWTITLDVGTGAGVRVGQTVTDGYGLVGRVLQADPSSSVVLLAADPGSGVGVRDERTGQLGVVTGRGTGAMRFAPLDRTTQVRVGDVLLTGPAGASSFVAGLAVGTVSAVDPTGAADPTAQVRATVSPTALDLVGVILSGGSAPDPALSPSAGAVQAAGGH